MFFYLNKKTDYCRFLCCPSKAISRILCYVIICLFVALLPESSELLLTESRDVFNPIFCFVLALYKDLAVSALHYYRGIPLPECIAFQLCRFCSHLAPCGGRSLTAIILSALSGKRVFGLSSPVRISEDFRRGAITHLAKTYL